MKKVTISIVPALLWFSSIVSAQSVVNTAHNLSFSGQGKLKSITESGICEFCHTPHDKKPMNPLWKKKERGTTYILYDNSISNTFQAIPGQPDGSSILCLSCHDGTTALGKVTSGDMGVGFGSTMTGNSNLTTDLSDDHPVSFIYNSSLAATDGQLKYPPAFPVRLDQNSKLQCISCHNPHKNTYNKFLVASNQFSELCFSCHDRNYWAGSSHSSSTQTWNGAGINPWAHIESPYSSVAENACENCHNPHNAEGKARLMKSGFEENNCLDCHNGNVAATNIETQLNKSYRHNVFVYNQLHNPLENADPSVVHIECEDCHNPHAVNNTQASAPYANGFLAGVRGINQNGNPVNVIQYEYELCYRCHADNPVVASSVTRQIEQNNVRMEFDQTNPSYHPVSGAGKNTDVPSLISPLNESSIIYCTSCHASNGSGSPAGPHGSIYQGILKYRYETTDNIQESFSTYELCYSCHSRTSILNDNSFKEHSKHIRDKNTPCSVCHDPHGINNGQGNSLNNSNLINFDRSVVSEDANGNLRFEDTGTFSGYCLLRCHGKTHDNGVDY